MCNGKLDTVLSTHCRSSFAAAAHQYAVEQSLSANALDLCRLLPIWLMRPQIIADAVYRIIIAQIGKVFIGLRKFYIPDYLTAVRHLAKFIHRSKFIPTLSQAVDHLRQDLCIRF